LRNKFNTISELMSYYVEPGRTIILSGERGHGKTATAISIAQRFLAGEWGHRHPYVITNVVFGYVPKDGGQPVEAYPPGVYHEDTLAGTMRKATEIVSQYKPGDCNILWMLDEAQNFMMSDQNGKKENLALLTYLGNARKLGICNMFMTPVLGNLVPRIRCFPDEEPKPGYCSLQMFKDKGAGKKFADDGRQITFVRDGPKMGYTPISIGITPWVKSIYSDVQPGNYGYDTYSMATFYIGENEYGVPFDLDSFIRACSKGLASELPKKARQWFATWDAFNPNEQEGELPGEDYNLLRIKDQCLRIARMRDKGIKWDDIAMIEGEVSTTLQTRFRKFRGET